MGYLQKELAATVDVTTREAISRLMENQIKQEMLAHVTEEYRASNRGQSASRRFGRSGSADKGLYTAIGILFGGMVGGTVALWLGKRKPTLKRWRRWPFAPVTGNEESEQRIGQGSMVSLAHSAIAETLIVIGAIVCAVPP